MKLYKPFSFLLIALVALVSLVGCGNGSANTQAITTSAIYAGKYAGGNIFLERDRGGGPMIEMTGGAILANGQYSANATLIIPGHEALHGLIEGGVSKDGIINAAIVLNNNAGTVSVGGGPLTWVTTRGGGPSRSLTGKVAVTYRLNEGDYDTVQYLSSTMELWQ